MGLHRIYLVQVCWCTPYGTGMCFPVHLIHLISLLFDIYYGLCNGWFLLLLKDVIVLVRGGSVAQWLALSQQDDLWWLPVCVGFLWVLWLLAAVCQSYAGPFKTVNSLLFPMNNFISKRFLFLTVLMDNTIGSPNCVLTQYLNITFMTAK